ncbi:MAG: hypothetical protein FWB79_01720 [Treponema sp.]|nr:hypothetical protein [Treponema sp.]
MTAWFLTLAVSAGLSMNLVLQLGLGVRELAGKPSRGAPLRLGVFFVSALVLWLVFSFARSVLPLGFLEYVLVFPVGVAVAAGWDCLFRRYLPGKTGSGDAFADGAPIGATLFATLALAGGFMDALVLSLGFSLGALLAVVIVDEIRRRAGMEAVPRWLRGAPLSIVAMGILSLVFSFAAVMFFEVLGGG